jgi:multidrug efflux pump subunit AcrA (membrane-fusion protein)
LPERPEHIVHFTTLARLRPPRLIVVMSWLVVVGVALSVAILLFVPWVQTAQGQGEVIALNPQDRVQQVSSLVPGRVEEFFVQDGQHVDAGDPIARVVDVDPNFLERLNAERAQFEAQIASIQQARSVAAIDVERYRQLLAEGLASRRDYEQSQIRIAETDARLAEARAGLNRIDVELNRQSAQVVRAPRDGRVQQINAAAGGALISEGTVLAVVAPERIERAVQLYIDGRDIALVRPGAPVRLEFESFPAIQFSGWPVLAQGLFDGRVRTIDPTARPDGMFRVIVEPMPGAAAWPDRQFVRQGSQVLGWIQGATVSVGYELWRQLNDFPLEFNRAPTTQDPAAASGAPAEKGA